ncbi:hypothetical protein COB55_03165 [Candidatus Wolfebacteria bacterium]|nr:MAG: hypothetical protein COB55_03165 [Candidatus Wolfebacteria bacterium]
MKLKPYYSIESRTTLDWDRIILDFDNDWHFSMTINDKDDYETVANKLEAMALNIRQKGKELTEKEKRLT